MANTALVHELNRLQRRLYDSYREFNTTQDNLATDGWKTKFAELALTRRGYYQAIRDTIKSLGSMPMDVTSPFSDAADEIFTDVKTFFSGEDDKFILQEARLKELKLVEAYQQALVVRDTPADLVSVMSVQKEEVEAELQHIQHGLDALS